jgi:hypothetical protein
MYIIPKYSQYDEEAYIVAALTGEPSRFLDVGAWHPTIFSNTRALVERGWGGVLIEPSPGPFINLLRACVHCGTVPDELYGKRHQNHGLKPCSVCGSVMSYGMDSKFTLILAGVGLEPGLVAFHATDDAVSTTSAAEHEKWEKVGGFYGKYLCPIITLEQIANQLGGFDMVNLDAEGVSCDLFLRALALGWRPRVFCVEIDRGREHEIGLAATNAGYVSHVTAGNVVLVKK